MAHDMQHATRRAMRHYSLALVLAAYFIVGGLYALRIPAWQAPDEPAHYNYVRQLAQTGQYPVIAPGDYDQPLIGERIAPPTARPDFPLDAVQYEDHQPPLFYTLAVPVFQAFGGALAPLRLLSLLAGALTVVFAYLAALEALPGQASVAAFAAAFVALLPQHLHMTASFNNDALAEALLALCLWLSARLIVREAGGPANGPLPLRLLAGLGIVAGLGFLTKATAYLALPVALLAVLMALRKRQPIGRLLAALALVAGVAVLIGLPWWLHGIHTYGGLDALGLQRHNQVVAGQPTTREWLAEYGAGGVLRRMAQTTFQSFWGQFGWMSVVLDARFYLALLAFTAVSTALFLAWWISSARRGLPAPQRSALTLFAALALGGVLGFAWYNLQFVQHQGRYLYPGLAPIATGLSLGWHFPLLRWPRLRGWAWLAGLLALAAFDVYLLWRVILPAMAA
jgi:4-amino-4-deoxy-L-arabinose transferase-like glycosyltransferase